MILLEDFIKLLEEKKNEEGNIPVLLDNDEWGTEDMQPDFIATYVEGHINNDEECVVEKCLTIGTCVDLYKKIKDDQENGRCEWLNEMRKENENL